MYVWYKIEKISQCFIMFKFKNHENVVLGINPFYTQKAVDGIASIGRIAAWLEFGIL